MLSWILRRMHRDEAGFTIIEAFIAMAIVAVLAAGVGATLNSAARNQRELRFQQQALALAVEGIEFSRSLDWDAVAMAATPVPGDPNASASHLHKGFAGLDVKETLVVDESDGLIEPHYEETLNGEVFNVFQYVSAPEDGLRRVVVFVAWTIGGSERGRVSSTLISEVGVER
jgi:type II secretory pathway pseudopilin PulG